MLKTGAIVIILTILIKVKIEILRDTGDRLEDRRKIIPLRRNIDNKGESPS
jgi:hypothetical protein